MIRTESDILSKAPIKVRFGDKDFEITVLAIGPSRRWRERLHKTMTSISKGFLEVPSGDNLAPALTMALLSSPEELAELIFTYAPDLPRDEVLELASDEQMAHAYGKIMAVAFPFLAMLKVTTEALNR